MLIAALAVIGELHGVRGTQQEPRPKQIFQRFQPTADGRLGGIHLLRGGGERATLNNAHKGMHQLHAVYTLNTHLISLCHTPDV